MKTRTQGTFWLNATVCLSGAALMTVELVASRLIARFLGSSLYTWTGVLGVILAGMSLGNYLGGRMADGARNLRGRVAVMFFASAAACLAILWLNGLAGQSPALMGLSWPARILLHMTWAFLLPATVLGTISPMIAKLAIDRSTQTGRAIGTLYAWNAVGSIAGTFVTGFYLTAWLGSVRIVVSMALVLAALGWLYAVAASPRFARRRHTDPHGPTRTHTDAGDAAAGVIGASLGLAVFAALFALALAPGETAAKAGDWLGLRDGPLEADAIYFAETQYQILTVTAEPGNPAHRSFFQDKLKHSEVDLSDLGDLKYPYMRIYDALVNQQMGRNREPVRLLLLGGGGYVFPNYLSQQRPGSELVVVEIDPGVTRAAQLAFGLPQDAPLEIVHMDARNYVADALRQNRAQPGAVPPFDLIVCDSVSDYSVPYQLTTLEFIEQVRQLLKPGGVYVMNLIDAFDAGGFMNAVAQTFEAVFPFRGAVSAVPELGPRNTTVFVGANQPMPLEDIARWTTRPDTFAGHVLDAADFAALRQRNGVCVLTDDYAPVENLLAPVVRMDRMGLLNAAVRRGIRAAEKGDLPRAVKAFERALEVAPNDESTLLNLARVHEMADAESAALDVYARLVQLYPANVMARNRAAMILARRGHLEPALEQWSASLDIQPAQPDVLNNLGALALQQGDRERAILYWQRALAYAPDADILRKNLAAVGAPPAAE
ncbi:MAG: fused MFS/spermidine synthase [Lentisphaerae bacterium]|jgi:spermidine synthase/Tfp pilus assembly protein PilF|nr:fused MFS/spermidine synthase [Lentisphaerota bacterium]